MTTAAAVSRDQQRLLGNSGQGNRGDLSSDTSIYIGKFTSLNNELGNLRTKAAEAGQSPQTSNPGNESPGEKEATRNLNVQDGANKFTSVLATAQARDFWQAQIDDINKQLSYCATKLGIDPNGTPPMTTGNEGKPLSPDNNVQEVQPGSGSETNTLTANPQGGQQQLMPGDGQNDSMVSGKEIEMDLGTLEKSMNSLPGGLGKYNGTFFGVTPNGEGSNVVGQRGADCGACAYLNATNQSSNQGSYGQVSGVKGRMNSNNPRAGVYPEQMARFLGQTPQSGIENLKQTLSSGKNAIVAVNPGAYSNSPGKGSHWVSIESKDFDPNRNTIKIEDSLSDSQYPESPGNSINPGSQGYPGNSITDTTSSDNPGVVTGDDIETQDRNLYDSVQKSGTYDLDKQAIRKREEDSYQRQESQSP
jgi:hypothetical protein